MRRVRGVCLLFGVLMVVVGFGVVGVGGAFGVEAAPSLRVSAAAFPSVLPVGQVEGKYTDVVENVGGAATSGEVTLRDVLPAGLSALSANVEPGGVPCGGTSQELVCSIPESIVPGGFAVVNIVFSVSGASGRLVNSVSASGGGSTEASAEAVTRTGGVNELAPAGVAHFGFEATGAAGEPLTQAGAHPTFVTTSVLLNNLDAEKGATNTYFSEPFLPIEPTKDLVFYLPLGMLGNATVPPQCPQTLLEVETGVTACPPSSRIGTVLPMILSNVFANTGDPTHEYGIYNVVPERGFPAEFGFASQGYTFLEYASVVRRNGTYMLRVAVPGVPPGGSLVGLVASFDGDISERFNTEAGERVLDRGAFLTNPTNCEASGEELDASVALDTWVHPDRSLPLGASARAYPAITGCQGGGLQFGAQANVRPGTTQADEPSGYEIGLEVPQAPNDAASLGTPPVRSVRLTLPAGTSISPGSAHGLVGCQETGPSGINIEGAESEETGPEGLGRLVAGHCPEASEIGSVSASSPLLREQLSGHLFIAQPECSPCTPADAAAGRLFHVYLEVQAPNSGVYIKLKGRTEVNQETGQITAVFNEGPQFPFSDLTVSLTRGPRAPIANGQACGTASSSGEIQSWSDPTPLDSKSSFVIDWNGSGGSCPSGPLRDPFAPVFFAGTTSPVAGSFSPFSLTLKREDREQNVSAVSTTLPEGLLADLNSVSRCPEALASQASLTACPAASQIGTVTVSVGSGSEPYFETGKVFLTAAYKGAPFGLSFVVPAVAGPFNLGNVLVRAKVSVNPSTAQVVAESEPFPQMLDGVPLRLRTLNVLVDAREFTLNPTGCQQMSVTGTVTTPTGGSVGVSSPFAVAGCKRLPFKPVLSGSTEKRSTKANGTGVAIKVSSPGEFGQAGLGKLVISLPKQLPTRLSTLQQACRAVVFEADPASCPAASAVATATVHTPILGQPLVGPGYLVSFGAAKFPDIVFVLQGEGITLKVDGQTFVSHSGVLRATFASVPDAPFTSFESRMPKGRFSLLTSSRSTGRASASQCGENLIAPVTMVSHSGVELQQNAKLTVTGCKPSVAIVRARKSAGGLLVSVSTTAKGRLTIGGSGVRTLVKSGVAAGSHTFSVALSATERRAARGHRVIVVNAGLVVGKQKASAHRRVAL